MKKKITCSLLVLILFTVTLLMFVGCERVDGLTTSQIFEIRKAYASIYGKFNLKKFFETKVLKYLGTYNGNIAVKMYYKGLCYYDVVPDPYENIGGIFVGRLNTCEIFALYIPPQNGKKGYTCELGGAYAEGWITKADLEKIAEAEQGAAEK